jgi:hypothetical protein
VDQKFVDTSGDTMTGALALPAGGLSVGSTQLVITAGGNIGIGFNSPTNKLAVNGTIKAREIIVSLEGWADHVFHDDYRLMPLEDLACFIKARKHLPEVPTADVVSRNGVAVGDMQVRLLKKIEELTLHVIAVARENAQLRERVAGLERAQAGSTGQRD